MKLLEVGRACSTHRRRRRKKNKNKNKRNAYRILVVNSEGKYYFFYLHIGGWNQGPLDTAAT
jgi:acetyl esterase/lipase